MVLSQLFDFHISIRRFTRLQIAMEFAITIIPGVAIPLVKDIKTA